MPRATTTSDAFNAIAEPKRREIIDCLALNSDRAVNDLVESLGISQPAMSKHLSVLLKVGLVTVFRQGKRRLYSLNAKELKPVNDWVKNFERFWDEHLDAIKIAAERKARERAQIRDKSVNHKPRS